MLFSQDRAQLRSFFFNAWQKKQARLPLEALESLIVRIIEQHPEYHTLLSNKEQSLGADYSPDKGETNPFLHMSMHIALLEQISTDRPQGIGKIYHTLLRSSASSHDCEHRMMECLGEIMWQAQKNQSEPDEAAYIECLKNRK